MNKDWINDAAHHVIECLPDLQTLSPVARVRVVKHIIKEHAPIQGELLSTSTRYGPPRKQQPAQQRDIFNNSALQGAVTKALANAPPSHRNAFVLAGNSAGGVDAVFTTKLGGNWSIDAVAHVEKGEKPRGGVEVKATW